MVFVYLHVVCFALWVLLNTGRFGLRPFDPFPYGLLTMVVSLEAIFLSRLVLITQNRLSEDVEKRADLEMETRPEDVLAEIARFQRLAQLNGPPAPKTISGRTTLKGQAMENSSTANELLWVEQQRADQAQTEFQHLEWRKRFALLLGLIALALTFATLLANLGAAGAIQSPASRAVPASTHEESPALTAPRHLTLGGHPAAAGVPPNSRRKASRPEWAEQMARLARLVHQG